MYEGWEASSTSEECCGAVSASPAFMGLVYRKQLWVFFLYYIQRLDRSNWMHVLNILPLSLLIVFLPLSILAAVGGTWFSGVCFQVSLHNPPTWLFR